MKTRKKKGKKGDLKMEDEGGQNTGNVPNP